MTYAKWWITTIALAMVLMFAGTAAAGNFMGKDGRHGRGHGPKGFKFLKRLDLTDAQRTRVRNIFSSRRDGMRSNAGRLMTARETLMTAMEAAPLDESAVRAAHRGLSEVKEEMTVLRARMLHEIKEVLTPEQNARFTRMRAEKRERMKDRTARRQARIDDRPADGPETRDDWDIE